MISKISPFITRRCPAYHRLLFTNHFNFATARAAQKMCYYKVLNVSTDATFEEIKKSYLELAKKYHPDVLTGEAVQEGKFLQISEAYHVLSDPSKRQEYNMENGFVVRRTRASTIGDEMNKGTHTKTATMSAEEKTEMDNYFQKKYFQNKDYFKLKEDDDPWNLTKKLYNTHADARQKAEEDYVIFHNHTYKAYYAHKDELKYGEDRHVVFGILYDYKYFFLGVLVLAGIFGLGEMLKMSKEEDARKQVAKKTKV